MRLLLPLLLSCTCRPEPAEPVPHYDGAERIRAHLIRGDLEGARQLARELDGGEVDPALVEYAESLHAGVGMVVAATDLEEASWGVAGIAKACGACHAAADVGLTGGFGANPVGDPGVAHSYAEELMWQGLSVPLEATFISGERRWSADMLERGLSAAETAEQAEEAKVAFKREASPGDAYSAALARCAGCHEAAEVTLSPLQPGYPE